MDYSDTLPESAQRRFKPRRWGADTQDMTRRTVTRTGKILVAAVGIAMLVTSCLSPQAQETADRLNADRAANGRPALVVNQMLANKAQAWAARLAGQYTLYHSNLSDNISGCWRSLGENVGYGGSIAIVENAYMNSSGHRANILNSGYQYVGTGVAYNGPLVFTVQEFMQGC